MPISANDGAVSERCECGGSDFGARRGGATFIVLANARENGPKTENGVPLFVITSPGAASVSPS